MSNSQMMGVRILCIVLGWVVGVVLFGAEATWLFDMRSFIWCGVVGAAIGGMLTSQK